MKKKIYPLFLLFLGMLACTSSIDFNETSFTEKIIVEGRIDYARVSEVILSINAPASIVLDSAALAKRLITSAEVYVTHGFDVERLKGKYLNHYPYFYYKGSSIVGEAGEKYELLVIYKDDTIRATTTIPERRLPKSITFEKVKDDIYKINVLIDYRQSDHFLHQFSTKIVGQNKRFIPELKPINYEFLKDGLYQHIVFKGRDRFVEDDLSRFFYKDSTVWLRFSAIDSTTALFWDSYAKETSSNIINTIGGESPIKSNVSLPAFGIWGGYNSLNYKLKVGQTGNSNRLFDRD